MLAELLEDPEFLKMADFTMYPYGNGRLDGESIACQHGAPECRGNTILACMQELYPISADGASPSFVKAFVCMEGKDGVPETHVQECAASNGLDHAAIIQCADGGQGRQLALAAARQTEALDPPHQYAPWVTIDGVPPPPSPCTNWTRLVLPPVLSGHV